MKLIWKVIPFLAMCFLSNHIAAAENSYIPSPIAEEIPSIAAATREDEHADDDPYIYYMNTLNAMQKQPLNANYITALDNTETKQIITLLKKTAGFDTTQQIDAIYKGGFSSDGSIIYEIIQGDSIGELASFKQRGFRTYPMHTSYKCVHTIG